VDQRKATSLAAFSRAVCGPRGTALEDKILQRALVEVLNAIYETDFLGFSYGFRPGRSPHHALDALAAGIVGKKVNWVLDADFSDYFSSLDHPMAGEVLGAPDRG
jgi:RNA-directed DNA polymerase